MSIPNSSAAIGTRNAIDMPGVNFCIIGDLRVLEDANVAKDFDVTGDTCFDVRKFWRS
jgi:hypothetical protein